MASKVSKKEPKKTTIGKKKKTIPKSLRMQLWTNTFGDTLKGKCYCCNRELQVDNFEAGHIISEKNKGETKIDNLKVVCKQCNTSCGTQNLEDFKKAMIPEKDYEKEQKIIESNSNKELENVLINEDKVNLIKNNSTYRILVRFGDEKDKFEKLCHTISENKEKWEKWYDLYKNRNGKKILLDILKMDIGLNNTFYQ